MTLRATTTSDEDMCIKNPRIRVSLMYHVNISLVRQTNVNVNRQNCQISISSVVRMARTNKVPNKQQTDS